MKNMKKMDEDEDFIILYFDDILFKRTHRAQTGRESIYEKLRIRLVGRCTCEALSVCSILKS